MITRPAAKRHRRGELRTGGEDSGGDRQERGVGGCWLLAVGYWLLAGHWRET